MYNVTLTTDDTETVLYTPTPKGIEFHAADFPFVLIGGGRNCGKSYMLRWDAHMRNLSIPGHRALLLRRTFPQLRGSHFADAAIEAKKLGCSPFHKTHYNIEYPNGSLLQFGHCADDAAILDYLSQEWDWIGFDELTTFTFDQFIRISASARTTLDSGRKAYVRGATNPIGEGSTWVKRYFVEKAIEEDENPEYRAEEWLYIHATLDDNPYADKEEYERKLLMLPSDPLRRAYRFGEWLVEGQFFSEWRERKTIYTEAGEPEIIPWHVIPELPRFHGESILKAPGIEITRAIDWGYSEAEPGWCGWFVHLFDGTVICFREWVYMQKTPEVVAKTIKDMTEGLKVRYTVGDPKMFHEDRGEPISETFRKNGVWMVAGDNERENGWVHMHSWLATTYNNGVQEVPRLRFLEGQCKYAIRSLPSLQTDIKRPRDVLQGPGVDDHAADAIRYFVMSRPSASREKRPQPYMPKELKRAILGANTADKVYLDNDVFRG